MRVRRAGSLPAALEDGAAVSLGGARWALLGGLDAGDTSTAAVIGSTRRVSAAARACRRPSMTPRARCSAGGYTSSAAGSSPPMNTSSASTPSAGAWRRRAPSGPHIRCRGGRGRGHRVHGRRLRRRRASARSSPGAPGAARRRPPALRAALRGGRGQRLEADIAGGSAEAAQPAILSFDPASGGVARIGSMPAPITHASAVSVGRDGLRARRPRRGGGLTDRGHRRDRPRQRPAVPVGACPSPLSDAAAIVDGQILARGRGRAERNGVGDFRADPRAEPALARGAVAASVTAPASVRAKRRRASAGARDRPRRDCGKPSPDPGRRCGRIARRSGSVRVDHDHAIVRSSLARMSPLGSGNASDGWSSAPGPVGA